MDLPGKHLDEPLNVSWIRNFSTKCGTQGEEYDAMIRTLNEYFNDLENESLSPVTATDQSMINPAVCLGFFLTKAIWCYRTGSISQL